MKEKILKSFDIRKIEFQLNIANICDFSGQQEMKESTKICLKIVSFICAGVGEQSTK
jgi:hypothetical protein